MAVNYIRSQALGITLATGCTGESGFDPVELWVMGPPCGLKVERALTSCMVMIERYVRGVSLSAMSATTLVPRARNEENHFPAH